MAPDPILLSEAEGADVPAATYRLQFHRGFTFADAARIVPYLHALGVSHLYASSYLAARRGSLHGYDIVDHNALNPEIGTRADYDALVDRLRAHGMAHILDLVPNHMGVVGGDNPWWNDVLAHGPASQYADFFDIDWDPIKRELANRVLLPVLGDQYGRVLESQALRLEYEQGRFRLRCYDTTLPVAPKSIRLILGHRLEALSALLPESDPDLQEYQSILTALANLPERAETVADRARVRMRETEVIARRLAHLVDRSAVIRESLEETLRVVNGKPGDPRSFDLLDRFLDEQAYRLAYWRVAAEEINYRRFFDINDLAAIRMENPAVFRQAHRLILQLVEEGKLAGLRLDHPDGLFDPPTYFLRLQRERYAQVLQARLKAAVLTEEERAAAAARGAEQFEAACREDPGQAVCRPLYLLAEKILAKGERLPVTWCIHGTVGYEFLNLVSGLFVDPAAEKALTAAYAAFTGLRTPFPDLVYECKKLILQVSMSSELSVLGHALSRLAERNRYSRDFTLNSLTGALQEVIACFPVYRTYITGRADVSLQDRACVEVAVAFAKRRNPATNVSVFDFVRDTLLLRYPESSDAAYREQQRHFLGKFQQLTAPVEAKGVEDTAFYRYHRLVSLNEVGGKPDQFGIPLADFHAQCRTRQQLWPAGLSASSTHDTKRSEDVRARIHVLSELPREWRAAVRRWHRLNRRHVVMVDGRPAPDRNDQYLFYQTLVGAWPLLPAWPEGAGELVGRLQAYMLKAAKEAKVNTSWINPNQGYDEALQAFVGAVLDPAPGNRFLPDFLAFHPSVARLGMLNSLAQSLIKVTAPGVPDFYQGTDLWDFSLVDPDNRRPVDYRARTRLLDGLRQRMAGGDLASLSAELVAAWADGRIKLYTIHRALSFRRAVPHLFRAGDYLPLAARGAAADSLCAFARRAGEAAALTIVPRLAARLTEGGARLPLGPPAWGDTVIELPPDAPPWYTDLFSGRRLEASLREGRPALPVAELLAIFPVALLVAGAPARG